MAGDFIRDSELHDDSPEVESKHKALFIMSDLSQKRGLSALRDSLVSLLPLATISTILYFLIACVDFASEPELINAITSFSVLGDEVEFNPAEMLALKYISPYLVFCALIPVFFSVAFTFEMSRKYRSGDALPLSIISGAITFITLYSPLFVEDSETSIMEFPINLMKENPMFLSGGVFVALLVSLLTYGLYRACVQRGIAAPLPINVTDALQGGFRVVLPGTIAAIIVLGLVYFVHEPFGHAIYYSSLWMTENLSGIYVIVIIVFLVQIFSFFGIQGASSVYAIFWILLLSGSVDPPFWGHGEASSGFGTLSTIFFFVMIGGTGSTLCLNIAMIRSKSNQIRKLGAMTLVPSLMNANDLIIYGLPLAFNRHLIVPFFLVPLVNLGIAFAAFSMGFMDAPELFVPPYIPAPLGAFLACGADWRAIGVSVVCILVGWAIYSYFLIPYDMKVTEFEEIPDKDARPRRTSL